MITARFYKRNGIYRGFIISGHSGTDICGKDIVCAGVSSAVMLTVNTVTEFFRADATVKTTKDAVGLRLNGPEEATSSRGRIYSLKDHLELVAEENGGIKVFVKDC